MSLLINFDSDSDHELIFRLQKEKRRGFCYFDLKWIQNFNGWELMVVFFCFFFVLAFVLKLLLTKHSFALIVYKVLVSAYCNTGLQKGNRQNCG